MGLNPQALRPDFPLLTKPDAPVFLDNACMTLKPRAVIDAVERYYTDTPFCGGRGVYGGAHAVSAQVQAAREAVAHLLDAAAGRVVFTKNATEAINLVAHAFPWKRGDVVLTSDREHNSNLTPWQALRDRGVRHEVFRTTPQGDVDLAALDARLSEGDVRVVAVVHVSNLDGTLLPVQEITRLAHAHGARVLVDGAQAAAHQPVSVREIGCDWYAVSLHKMLGPTGVGCLVGNGDALDALGSFLVGGDTVASTTYAGFELLDPPNRFEAGLQNYAGLAAVPATVEYLQKVGLDAVHAHEAELTRRLDAGLRQVPGVRVLGPPADKRGGITSFTCDFLDPHQVAILLDDKHRIWVRSGDHCVHSWFNEHGVEGAVRASTYLYNTPEEVDALVDAVADLSRRLHGA